MKSDDNAHRMVIKRLVLDPNSNLPIVILQKEEGSELMPIWIGLFEANAIALKLETVEVPRPMTHDLFAQTLSAMDISVERVVITELRERTFFAEVHMRSPGEAKVMSARPSDAIALAVRMGVPIFAEDELLAEVGYSDAADVEEESEEIVEDFRDFIDSVNPEDFA